MTRAISRKVIPDPPAPGFIGAGHTAVEVVAPDELAASDPFVLLMDDRLDMPTRRQIGGPHPHAGLETVTLILEGTLDDRDEGRLSAGDLAWMTAGRGVVHNEAVETSGRSRILQLWVALPARERGRAPRFEVVPKEAAPVIRAPGVEGRLYSGSSGPLRSRTQNIVPVTLVDLVLAPAATFTQDVPASYNGFVYVIDGDVSIAGTPLAAGEVGWFAPAPAQDLTITAGPRGGRLVLYAGEPVREPLVHHGPFVAGSPVETRQLYQRFRAGEFALISEVARAQQAS